MSNLFRREYVSLENVDSKLFIFTTYLYLNFFRGEHVSPEDVDSQRGGGGDHR